MSSQNTPSPIECLGLELGLAAMRIVYCYTPLKNSMEPKNYPSEKENHLINMNWAGPPREIVSQRFAQ